jgi:nucleoid-associated protein YgaU
MGTMMRKPHTKALVVGLVFALSGAPLWAQDGPPSDADLASVAPQGDPAGAKPAKGDAPVSDGNSKEVYGKHVERVKKIRSLFDKLKVQVEAMETQQETTVAQLPPDLPPEALATEDDPVPETEQPSVLDEAPNRKKPKAGAIASKPSEDDRELAESAGGSTGTYTVKSGDTLGKIASKLLGSQKKAERIAKANGMKVGEPLKVGRELIIPGGGRIEDTVGDVAVGTAPKEKKSKDSKKKERKPKNPASEPVLDYSNYDFKMYVVKPGDSLSKIAKAFYESGNGAELIRKYNKLGGSATKENPLKAGEKILIPLPKQKASEERYEKAKKGIF